MPKKRAMNDADYTVILVAAPIDIEGRLINLRTDPSGIAKLFFARVDELDKRSLARSLKAARRYEWTGLDGRELLYRAVCMMLLFNRLIVTLCLDGTTYFVTGEEFREQRCHLVEEYALMAALQESGLTEEPISDADFASTDDFVGPGVTDSRPIASWIARLALETEAGQRLPKDQTKQLREWSHGEGESPLVVALVAESEA